MKTLILLLTLSVSAAAQSLASAECLFYAVAPAMFGGGKPKAREQASEIKRRNRYEGLIAMAWVLADGNNPQGAEVELLEAVAAYPDSVEPARALTDLYLSRLNRGSDA